MQWYYAENGQRVGPIAEEELHGLAAQGRIKPDTLVWTAGMKDWAPYGKTAAKGSLAPEPAQEPAASGGGGNTPNSQLMAAARRSLSGSWGPAIGACVVPGVLISACMSIPVVGVVAGVLISGACVVGMAAYFVRLSRHRESDFGLVFSGFKNFWPTCGAYVLVELFVMLWSLLLIIPGIIASFRYAMTFYIMADDPAIGPMDAIRASKAMMKGKKWKLFCLGLRFIGWSILAMLTFGIGFLWLMPYMMASFAHFYNDVKSR